MNAKLPHVILLDYMRYSVKAPRIVTWIRYGSMISRQSFVAADKFKSDTKR